MSDNNSFEIPFDLGASCLASFDEHDENDASNLDANQHDDRDAPTAPSPITIYDSDDSATDGGKPSSSVNPLILFGRKELQTCKQTKGNGGIEADDGACTSKVRPQTTEGVVEDEDQVMEPVEPNQEPVEPNQEPQEQGGTREAVVYRLDDENRTLMAPAERFSFAMRMMKLREERL